MATDKRDIWVTGADDVVRPVTVTFDPRVSMYGDYWRVTRQNARRIAGQPLRTRYNPTVTIQGMAYSIVHQTYHTYTGKPRRGYYLVRCSDRADCLKRG